MVFLLAVATPLRIPRLAAHFAQNRSEIEGRVRVGDRPNSRRSMHPTRLLATAKCGRCTTPPLPTTISPLRVGCGYLVEGRPVHPAFDTCSG